MLQLEGTVAALMLSWPWLEYVARKLNMSLVYSPIRSARTCVGARVCGASPSKGGTANGAIPGASEFSCEHLGIRH